MPKRKKQRCPALKIELLAVLVAVIATYQRGGNRKWHPSDRPQKTNNLLLVFHGHAQGHFPVEGAVRKLSWTLDSARNERLCYVTCNLLHTTSLKFLSVLNGQVHCFSMQVVMNKCFLLNPEKKLAQICLVLFEKNAPLISKNDVTEPKARLLYQPVKLLIVETQLPETMVTESLKLSFNLLTAF